jgi:hypothetical protein
VGERRPAGKSQAARRLILAPRHAPEQDAKGVRLTCECGAERQTQLSPVVNRGFSPLSGPLDSVLARSMVVGTGGLPISRGARWPRSSPRRMRGNPQGACSQRWLAWASGVRGVAAWRPSVRHCISLPERPTVGPLVLPITLSCGASHVPCGEAAHASVLFTLNIARFAVRAFVAAS